ncbi:MAG: hypothetical protein K2Q06_16270, partial [Parvularculaceae bacterium]|nr:hypothetical protein [Parvularculaceae bacterium]
MAQAFRAAKSEASAGARLFGAHDLPIADWTSLSENASEPNVFATPWTLSPALARFMPDWIRFACAYDDDGAMIGFRSEER